MNEIDTYQPGRPLDALVAKEVFAYTLMREQGQLLTYQRNHPEGKSREELVPRYSSHDEAALLIVRHLCQDNREPYELYFKLVYGWWPKNDNPHNVPLVRAIFDWKGTTDTKPLYQGLADSIPLAVCRAALRVVREDLSLPEW